jgi:hypothetical protein
MRIRIHLHFNTDQDPAVHFNADRDPGPASRKIYRNLRPMIKRPFRAPFWASRPPLWASTVLFETLRLLNFDFNGDTDLAFHARILIQLPKISGPMWIRICILVMPHPWLGYTAKIFAALFSLLTNNLVTAKSINHSTKFRDIVYIVHFWAERVAA